MIDPVKNPLDPAKCGTPSQARAHRRRGEKPCTPCKYAESADFNRRYHATRATGRKPQEWYQRCSACGHFVGRAEHQCKVKAS